MKLLKALLIGFICIVAPIVLLLFGGIMYVAWPLFLILFLLLTPGLVVGVIVGSSNKDKKKDKGSD